MAAHLQNAAEASFRRVPMLIDCCRLPVCRLHPGHVQKCSI